MNIPRPPAHVEPYVTALGAELAVRFFLEFGGADLYIPADPKGQGMVAKTIGIDGARALSAIRDRLQARVPTAKPWLAQYMAEVEGLSKAEIARKLHTTNVSVARWLDGDAAPRPFTDPRQHKLPL